MFATPSSKIDPPHRIAPVIASALIDSFIAFSCFECILCVA